MMRAILPLIATVLGPAVLAGQQASLAKTPPPPAAPVVASGYAHATSDTVRYREQATTSMVLEDPRGTIGTSNAVNEVVALTFRRADSANVWFEALDARTALPGKMINPRPTNSLNHSFTLKVDARGHVQVTTLPAMDDSIARMVDVRADLGDFLPRLPAGPLAVGMEWVDTVAMKTEVGMTVTTVRTIYHYKAERDTTVDDGPALVLTATDDDSLTISTPAMHGEPATAASLQGSGTSTVVFVPSIARLIARDRSTQLTGISQTFTGANVKMLPETLHFDESIRRVASP